MRFHIITLFPSAFDSYLGESIIKRAIEDKKIKVVFYNPRDFSDNKFRHIDQKPYSPIVFSDTAKGNRNATSRSKMMKRMETR